MSEEQQLARDPFYDIKPERVWLDVTNIGVRARGMVRVMLRVNEQDRELYHSYVHDGIVSNGYSLTWLFNHHNDRISALEAENARLTKEVEWRDQALDGRRKEHSQHLDDKLALKDHISKLERVAVAARRMREHFSKCGAERLTVNGVSAILMVNKELEALDAGDTP